MGDRPEEREAKRQKTAEGAKEDAQLEPQLVEGMQELEGIQNKLDEVGWTLCDVVMCAGVKARTRMHAHSWSDHAHLCTFSTRGCLLCWPD